MDRLPFPTIPAVQHHMWLPPNPPYSSTFWDSRNVTDQLRELHESLSLAKVMQKELEVLMTKRGERGSVEDKKMISAFAKNLEDRKVSWETQESLSVEAANSLMSKLRALLEPFRVFVDKNTPWEEKSAAVRLCDRVRKSKRNKLWRKRQRKRVAEIRQKENERYEQTNREADEWRAREIARDAAQVKVEKMKEIAKLKAKEEKKKLESELELVLIVERLQDLRSIRIQKLKKQGHFLPEQDDEFLERVRAAVEEEERQAMAAVDTTAAKDAIATVEGARKAKYNVESPVRDSSRDDSGAKEIKDQVAERKDSKSYGTASDPSEEKASEVLSHGGAYDSLANLPVEFYHYYHGSNNDMGTLIEVRRMWDAYIRTGGSRIPGHWVQPPPPSNDVWASYLVKPR
ncbi:hypothetical protein K2173_018667 [Erythroxylum novogranatense]|uniref:Uncharacterized protein n=1 Tax=Erythroxylum novogranatense TaxID=1862640 RepID=A0AAV8SAY1_9ROSI|nr:hypothetical protein K2173_018667 [Erythroxylum novogranatense]